MTDLGLLPGDAQLLQWLAVALVAFAASILGGLAGYGTGLVLPVVLAPVVGVAQVVPVMALAMVLNNGSRVAAFWRDVSRRTCGACCCSACPPAWPARSGRDR